MKAKYLLSLIICSMIAAIVLEVLYFHTLNYIFRTIFLFTSFSVITELSARGPRLSATGKLARFCVFGLLFSLVIVPTVPLVAKSDYLEITEVSYVIPDLNVPTTINIKVKWWAADGICDKYGAYTEIRVALGDYANSLTAPQSSSPTATLYKSYLAKDCEGKTKETWFNGWIVKNYQGTFKATVNIANANAAAYTVEKYCQLQAPYPPDTVNPPGSNPPSSEIPDVTITQVQIEVYSVGTEGGVNVVDFGLKVTAYNGYTKDLTSAYFQLESKPDEVKYSGSEKIDLSKIVSRQSRTSTFKTFTVAHDGDPFTIEFGIHGNIKDVGDVSATKEVTIDPTTLQIASPSQNNNTDNPNIFGELFSAVINDPTMQPIFIMILLGFPIVLIGAGMDSKKLMGLGAFVSCFPAGLSIFAVFLGWVVPAQYFVDMAGESLAPLAQGMVTLFVVAIVVSVSYTFAGLVGSARE